MSRIDLSGINELAIQVSAICPGCGHPMHYEILKPAALGHSLEGLNAVRVYCANSGCGELNKRWDLDMRTGIGKRVQP